MTPEKFEKASKIQADIDSLCDHIREIVESRIMEGISYISCQYNRSFTPVNLRLMFMRQEFVKEYVATVKDKIAELEAEFNMI